MEAGMVVAIRTDISESELRRRARRERNARVACRMLAIANALSGMSRKAAAEAAGMDRQTLRDWVVRYNTDGIDGLADRWGDGRPQRLSAQEREALSQIIVTGPEPETDGISAYTLDDLAALSAERFGKPFHPASMSRVVRRLGFSRQKARPHHPKTDMAEQEAFKKSP
jgi:transposase